MKLNRSEIGTNCRGEAAGKPLDGCLDGWTRHAWYGLTIAYGADEDAAVAHLLEKLVDLEELPEPDESQEVNPEAMALQILGPDNYFLDHNRGHLGQSSSIHQERLNAYASCAKVLMGKGVSEIDIRNLLQEIAES